MTVEQQGAGAPRGYGDYTRDFTRASIYAACSHGCEQRIDIEVDACAPINIYDTIVALLSQQRLCAGPPVVRNAGFTNEHTEGDQCNGELSFRWELQQARSLPLVNLNRVPGKYPEYDTHRKAGYNAPPTEPRPRAPRSSVSGKDRA